MDGVGIGVDIVDWDHLNIVSVIVGGIDNKWRKTHLKSNYISIFVRNYINMEKI